MDRFPNLPAVKHSAEEKETMTLERLRKIAEELKRCSLKPYKGCFELNSQGLFEIKDEVQFQRLKANDQRRLHS